MDSSAESVQRWLQRWFEDKKKIPDQSAKSLLDIDYFAAGWLTSMEVVEFVTDIELNFAMQFSDRDLQDPRFVTIAGLTELILQSTQPPASR